MRFFYFMSMIFLSSAIYGKELNPCQLIPFSEILDATIPDKNTISFSGLSIKDRPQMIDLLKKCLQNYSVCVVEAKMGAENWFSEELKMPDDKGFDPLERSLLFGLIQYKDKKTGAQVCIAAENSFFRAVPWLPYSWVISMDSIKKYDILDARYTVAMTPSELYQAFLDSHEEAVENEIEKNKNHLIGQ